MTTAAERQKAFRARQLAEGRKPRTVLMTDDEAFYMERMLAHMRANKGTAPALMRGPDGRFQLLDV